MKIDWSLFKISTRFSKNNSAELDLRTKSELYLLPEIPIALFTRSENYDGMTNLSGVKLSETRTSNFTDNSKSTENSINFSVIGQ